LFFAEDAITCCLRFAATNAIAAIASYAAFDTAASAASSLMRRHAYAICYAVAYFAATRCLCMRFFFFYVAG